MTNAEKVIEIICDTGQSMKRACKTVGITPWSFLRAIEKENLAQHYARAIEVRSDTMFDDMVDIADDNSEDFETRINKAGEEYEVFNPDVVQRAKLMIDTRKWILSRMNPKKYGDKIDLTSDGKAMPIPRIIMPKLDDE